MQVFLLKFNVIFLTSFDWIINKFYYCFY